jgi:hypothetical protein
MFKRIPSKGFSNKNIQKRTSDPIPVYENNNTSVPIIRQDVDPAFYLSLDKSKMRTSGLEKK